MDETSGSYWHMYGTKRKPIMTISEALDLAILMTDPENQPPQYTNAEACQQFRWAKREVIRTDDLAWFDSLSNRRELTWAHKAPVRCFIVLSEDPTATSRTISVRSSSVAGALAEIRRMYETLTATVTAVEYSGPDYSEGCVAS